MKITDELGNEIQKNASTIVYAKGLYQGYLDGIKSQKRHDIEIACKWLYDKTPLSGSRINELRKFMEEAK